MQKRSLSHQLTA